MGEQSQSASYRDVLRIRDYRRLLGAFVVDAVGGWAYSVILVVYVFERTDSTLMVSLASVVRWGPALVLGPLGGLIADRYERVRVMVMSAFLAAVGMSVMALVVAGDGPIWLLLVLTGAVAVVMTPYAPAAGAMRVEVVDEQRLIPANALFSAVECLTVVVGPLLGGVLLLLDERAWGFAINALSFLAAIAVVSTVKARSQGGADPGEEPFLTQLGAGVVTIWREPVVRTLVLFVALDSAVYGATSVLYVPLAADLGEPERGFGYLLAAFAVGGLFISFVVNRLAARPRLAPTVLGGMLVLALPFGATVLTDSLAVGLALQVVAGAGMVLVDVIGITALQRSTDRQVLSRALGALDTIALAGILAGNLLMVPLLAWGGVNLALGAIAGIVTLVTLFGIRPVVRADARGAAEAQLLAPRVGLLEALDIFTGASQAVLERMASAVEEVVAEPGLVLMRQGEQADALWVVVSGAVDISTRQPDGSHRVVSALGAHSYVGEIGLLQRIPRTATVTTTAPSRLWRIPADEFFASLSESAVSPSFRAVSQSRLVQLNRAPLPQPRQESLPVTAPGPGDAHVPVSTGWPTAEPGAPGPSRERVRVDD